MVTSKMVLPDLKFWKNKRTLITGHSGFKGGWLSLWLNLLGADVTGISLPPKTEPNLFQLVKIAERVDNHFCDICDETKTIALIRQIRPEIVFHLAAQPLVRESYQKPVVTFSTNVMGTIHVLEALRSLDTVRVAVLITTDKVYQNNEWTYPYRENDVLGGHDPYSASKAAAEIVSDSYRKAFLSEQGVAVATARAGNVIGGGDWAEDRLIPDAVRTWQAQKTLHIRCPNAIRPWQHVLEPLAGYIMLAEKLWTDHTYAGPWNFGPETHCEETVRHVIHLAKKAYGRGEIHWGNNTDGPHEAGRLSLETSKSRTLLNVRPRWNLEEAVVKTMMWYSAVSQGKDAGKLCEKQIQEYSQANEPSI